MYVCMYVCMCKYVCINVYIYICMYMYMHVCMYVCLYVFIYSYDWLCISYLSSGWETPGIALLPHLLRNMDTPCSLVVVV